MALCTSMLPKGVKSRIGQGWVIDFVISDGAIAHTRLKKFAPDFIGPPRNKITIFFDLLGIPRPGHGVVDELIEIPKYGLWK